MHQPSGAAINIKDEHRVRNATIPLQISQNFSYDLNLVGAITSKKFPKRYIVYGLQFLYMEQLLVFKVKLDKQ